MTFTVIIENGDNGWLVGQLAELPGVLSQGKTKEELVKNMLDALNEYLAAEREHYERNAE